MAKINSDFEKLAAGYLFGEIAKRTNEYIKKNPGVEIMRLGIGNTTEPIPPAIIKGLHDGVDKLADVKTYSGYGDEQGNAQLRQKISDWYKLRGVTINPSEIFVSDGAKPDSSNIQVLFDKKNIIAICDPVYPVYVDSNVIAGRTGKFKNGKYEGLVYLPCTEENSFFPNIPNIKVDVIYLCSPNNPTGAVATKKQLRKFVDYARKNKAIIVFDSAYSFFISDDNLPRSIYEIPGAKKCAIEINSFSKFSGFTGVRLGWSVVPMDIETEDAGKGVMNSHWNRRQTTMFNGASNIAQAGGLAALSPAGLKECQKLVDYYMKNAKIIKTELEKLGLTVFGGVNAPYIWLKTPNDMSSWEFFDKLLSETGVVGTPGSGFGSNGEGYFRLSAFGHRDNIKKAVKRIKDNLKI